MSAGRPVTPTGVAGRPVNAKARQNIGGPLRVWDNERMAFNCAEDPANPMGSVLANTATGKTIARHPSRRACEGHMDALYANSPAVKQQAADESGPEEAAETPKQEAAEQRAPKMPPRPKPNGRMARIMVAVTHR